MCRQVSESCGREAAAEETRRAEAGRQRAAEEEELAIRQAEEELAGLLALKEEKDAAVRTLHIELDEELKRTKEKEEENKKTNGELARITPKNKNLAKEVELSSARGRVSLLEGEVREREAARAGLTARLEELGEQEAAGRRDDGQAGRVGGWQGDS